jgi:hypothetical protein
MFYERHVLRIRYGIASSFCLPFAVLTGEKRGSSLPSYMSSELSMNLSKGFNRGAVEVETLSIKDSADTGRREFT